MPSQTRALIACGMYAFAPVLQQAWTSLLQDLPALINGADPTVAQRARVVFDTSDSIYQSPDLLIGHTCGYPWLYRWRETHRLLAVPVFDIPGCREYQYSSWFVCRNQDSRETLTAFKGALAAVNDWLSNSGMNVFRHAIADIAGGKRFFSSVKLSGSHRQSMQMIISGEVDIAAIDAITWFHTLRLEPELTESLRILGQSAYTPGLPFIQRRSSQHRALPGDTLNEAFIRCPTSETEQLRIVGFTRVCEHDYRSLEQLERYAKKLGYPRLQ